MRVEITWTPPLERYEAAHDEMADRAEDLRPSYGDAMDLLERLHRRGFARLAGEWTLTGRTEASLTGRTGDSVREVSRTGAEFGTSVSYAPYLTMLDRDPELGQVRNQGSGRHAVLFFPGDVADDITDSMADYITEPF